MYPIKFENLYYDKIWGGRDLEEFRDNLPEGNIGESWDIACHEHGMGIVTNGNLKGKSFKQIIDEYGHDLVGEKVSTEKFPLLVKFINAKDKLSVQVHPGDEYAMKNENQFGKTEAWYVVDAKPGAELIVGTKNCTKEQFKKAIDEGRSEEYLNVIEVKKGDAFLINSGMVHAIGEGLIIAEIQQNSDVTYRVYDYGRPREIHVEKSLDVIDFNLHAKNLANNQEEDFNGFKKIDLCENQYFGIKKIVVDSKWENKSEKDRFHILTCVEGEGTIKSEGFSETIKCGDSYLIPASLGKYEVLGNLTILESYSVVK